MMTDYIVLCSNYVFFMFMKIEIIPNELQGFKHAL